MTIDSTNPVQPDQSTHHHQPARTDDLLAGGAETADGARGFDSKAAAQPLQTGMEGIAEATVQQGNRQTGSSENSTTETVQEKAVQERNKQG